MQDTTASSHVCSAEEQCMLSPVDQLELSADPLLEQRAVGIAARQSSEFSNSHLELVLYSPRMASGSQ
jgi:hypothetical protein